MPLRIYRRDSSSSQLAGGATAADTPKDVPCLGFASVMVSARSPTGAFTITIQGKLKGSSTATTIATLTCAAGSMLNQAIAVGAFELLDVALVNGASAQRPEVILALVRIGEVA